MQVRVDLVRLDLLNMGLSCVSHYFHIVEEMEAKKKKTWNLTHFEALNSQ